MSVTASRPPAPVVAAAPQAAPTPDREPNSLPAAHPFAELLRQNRSVDDRAPAEPPRPGKDADATELQAGANEVASHEEAPLTSDLSTRSDAGRARARAAASSRGSPRTTDASARPARERDAVAPHASRDDDSASADDASAPNPIGAAHPEAFRPADSEPRARAAMEAQQPGEAAGRARATTQATTSVADANDSSAGGARQRRPVGELAGPADAGRTPSRARDSAGQAPAASFAQALAEARAPDRPATAAAERPLAPAFDPAVAPHDPLPQAPLAGDAAALATTLPAPIDSPEFASALGVQVSVFVREGVHHAELHLNPAETGPVSIAITLDGTQARVEFGADLAATRQAIENGLPALASALRDAGFTLAGGGVAQHSRPGGGQGGDDPADRSDARRPQARGSDAVVPAGPRMSHRVAAGGIDVYA